MTNENNKFITGCFYATAFYNIIGSVVFSKLLTNDYLESLDPNLFSDMGWIGIFLWGLAYLSVAKSYQHVPHLILVFFVEKVIYTTMWVSWLSKNYNNLPEIYAQDSLTGTFFSLYGSGDFISAIFFLWIALKYLKK